MFQEELKEKGYCIIENVLSASEIETATDHFRTWKNSIPNLDEFHHKCSPHGIFKFHEVGHQHHAWYLRTLPQVQEVFKTIYSCNELVVSFDGSGYIPKSLSKKDTCWTHTDQAPNAKSFKCVQGLLALTSNKERTLVVYEGSHLQHKKYFEDRGITGSKNWHKIDPAFLDPSMKRVLNIPAGSLVLWDSRTFHQNQYGKPGSEERIVQYVCFLPKNNKGNSFVQQRKRLKYFNERRTTSHWPYPINLNSLQPRTFGDDSRKIDYTSLKPVEFDDEMLEKIHEII